MKRANNLPRTISSTKSLLVILGVMLFLIPVTVDAQEKEEYILEDTIVTATRTGETNLQETALTLSVFDDQSMNNLSSYDLEDLAHFMPSTRLVPGDEGPLAYLRGIGTNFAGFAADQNVGFYLDGVYLHLGTAAMVDFVDVERIEVLRGPQGTLYGRNTTGGAINIITKPPSSEFELMGSVDIGNYAYRRVDAMISGPIVEDRVRVRFTASDGMHDGYFDNLGGRDLRDNDYHALRGSIQFLGEQWDLVISGDYREVNMGYWNAVKLIGYSETGMSGYLALLQGIDPDTLVPEGFYTMHYDDDSDVYNEFWGLSSHLDVDLGGDMRLKYIAAYRELDEDRYWDVDGSQVQTLLWEQVESYEEFTQEVQLMDEFEGDWGHFQWLVGGYYYEMSNVCPHILLGGVQSRINLIETGFAEDFGVYYTVDSETYAGFGSVTLTLPNDLALTAGIRYSKDEKQVVEVLWDLYWGDIIYSFGDPSQVGWINGPAQGGEWSDWTPKFGLEYSGIEDVLLYATYSEGYKSGYVSTTNPLINLLFGTNFDSLVYPETVEAFEVGIKSDWLDRKLRINASAFHYDYTDLQVFTSLGDQPIDTNAGEAELYGGELELLARPIPALTLNGSLAYLNTEYSEFIATDPVTGELVDANGNQLVQAPEWNLILGANYVLPVEDYGFMTFGANAVWQDDIFCDPTNAPWSKIDDHWIVNALVRYETEDGHWSMELWTKNLFEKEYYQNLTASGEDRYGMMGDPMTMGFKVVYNY